MNVYSTTQARSNFSELINKVTYEKQVIVLGRNNKKEVLMVPYPQIDEGDLPLSEMNAASASFDFLDSEPELYSFKDLKKQYV